MVGKTGSAQVAIVLPEVVSTEKPVEGSRLVLTRNDAGESFVSALYLGDLGLSLHYATPKAQTPAAETAKLGPIAQAASEPGRKKRKKRKRTGYKSASAFWCLAVWARASRSCGFQPVLRY